jgi:uncharacterized protein (TIGR00369 family)
MLETVSGAVSHASAFLGLRITKAAQSQVDGEFVAGDHHLNHGGRVAGMALQAFAEALSATGILLNLKKGMSTATIESKTSFFKAATRGLILGQAIPLHLGRNTTVWQTTITDERNLRLAIVTQTQIVLPSDGPDAQPAAPLAAPPVATSSVPAVAKVAPGDGTRARVLAAAADVILQKGFAGASMRDIAAAASLSVSSLYQYVDSKDDLLTMIFDGYMSDIIASVAAASYGGKTASGKLRAAIESTLGRFSEFRKLINLMNRETRSLKPAARRRVLAHMDGYVQLFRKIVQDGIEHGEFRDEDPELVAHLIVMLCEIWPQRHWAVGRHGPEAVFESISKLVLDGLRGGPVRSRT